MASHDHIDQERAEAAEAAFAKDSKRLRALLTATMVYGLFCKEAAALRAKGVRLVRTALYTQPVGILEGPTEVEAALRFDLTEGVSVLWRETEPDVLLVVPVSPGSPQLRRPLPDNGGADQAARQIAVAALELAHAAAGL